MKGCRSAKVIIKNVLVLLLTMFVFIFLVQLYNILTKKDPIAAAYDLASGSLNPNDSAYISNNSFTIGTTRGMERFSESVYNGCTFAGKTVTLTNDIDFWDRQNGTYKKFNGVGSGGARKGDAMGDFEYYKPFCGSFDGNGYTVSNFYIKHNTKMIADDDGDFKSYKRRMLD